MRAGGRRTPVARPSSTVCKSATDSCSATAMISVQTGDGWNARTAANARINWLSPGGIEHRVGAVRDAWKARTVHTHCQGSSVTGEVLVAWSGWL
jgi:hypothetical protein